MSIRQTVVVGQQGQSNDPRRFSTVVQVERIVSYETGLDIEKSTLQFGSCTSDPSRQDRVQVRNLQTGKRTTIRRDQFATGVRGWSLFKEVAAA